ISGSEGVFHTACPVLPGKLSDPEIGHLIQSRTHGTDMNFALMSIAQNEMVAPAVDGTLNVLKACSEAKVGRVILVSSTVAVAVNPNWPKDQIMDENCWSDKEFCKNSEKWYCFAKTIAEEKALNYGREARLDIVSVCPCLVLGPMLQPTVNASSFGLIQTLKGLLDPMENMFLHLVDVRDVADALLLAYEKPEAAGRYICCSHGIKLHNFVDKLRNMYPNFKYRTTFIEVEELDNRLSSEKLKKLGWKERTLDECIADSVEHLIKTGGKRRKAWKLKAVWAKKMTQMI
ncbi:hypothetical protein Taro_039106, partial [Colocasia esculenta]|nr:hypothetical protein [Colocasia esculenta]